MNCFVHIVVKSNIASFWSKEYNLAKRSNAWVVATSEIAYNFLTKLYRYFLFLNLDKQHALLCIVHTHKFSGIQSLNNEHIEHE